MLVRKERVMIIKSKAYQDMLAEEQSAICWLNDRMCIGYKRDLAYQTLERIRTRKAQYEKAVKENSYARKTYSR